MNRSFLQRKHYDGFSHSAFFWPELFFLAVPTDVRVAQALKALHYANSSTNTADGPYDPYSFYLSYAGFVIRGKVATAPAVHHLSIGN